MEDSEIYQFQNEKERTKAYFSLTFDFLYWAHPPPATATGRNPNPQLWIKLSNDRRDCNNEYILLKDRDENWLYLRAWS